MPDDFSINYEKAVTMYLTKISEARVATPNQLNKILSMIEVILQDQPEETLKQLYQIVLWEE